MQEQPADTISTAGDPARNGEWEKWMAASLAGDRGAYERLLRAMLPMLRDIARSRITDRDDAEDVVQDTLLTVHILRHTCQPERPVHSWVAAICERRCAGRLSQQRGRRRSPWTGRTPANRDRLAIDAAQGLTRTLAIWPWPLFTASLHDR